MARSSSAGAPSLTEAGLRLRRFATVGADPLYFLQTPSLSTTGGLYVSAGIHGDEPASTEALIAWAEKHARRLAGWPLLLFPCLNPSGLRQNIRLDASGLDLNRAFHLDDHPVIRGMKQVASGHRFDLAVMLHEDYDGEGFYLYEIGRGAAFLGEAVLAAVGRHIALDPRGKIDGYTARTGLIRRRFARARFERIGFPEAIWLYEHHSSRALTLETPSEFALADRVRAHVAALEECMRRIACGARRAVGAKAADRS